MENRLYIAAAVVIVIAVAAAAYVVAQSGSANTYDVSVSLAQNGTHSIVYPYQRANFTIMAWNNGSKEVSVPIGFYVEGSQISYHTYAIPAHNSITIPENYTYMSYGQFLINAKIDPAGVLKVSNRNATSSSIVANVTAPQIADVYTSVPNNDIAYTVSFSMSGTGMYSMALLGGIYNIGYFNAVSGLGGNLTARMLEDLYSYMASANGAYSEYPNGTKSYVAWLGGTVTPEEVNIVVSSFGKNESKVDNGTVSYFMLSNTISLCDEYSGGWTKLVEYYNAGGSLTCAGIMRTGYNDTLSSTLVKTIKSSNTLTTLQSRFTYLNSTPIGNILEYDGSNISVSDVFQLNAPHGLFISRAAKFGSPHQLTTQQCRGLVYSSNTANVCSTVLLTANGSAPSSYDLLDSKMLTTNYSLDLFSFINSSYLVAAHENGARLIGSLGLKAPSVQWASTFSNSCMFSSNTLGCSVSRFDYINNTAYLNITDRLSVPIKVNHMSCALLAGGSNSTSPNTIITANGIATVKVPCVLIPISGVAAVTQYNLRLNYTASDVTAVLNGTLNVTNVV